MDYKERLKIEYKELDERIGKLQNLLEKYFKGELDFTPNCSYDLLHEQLVYMEGYRAILERRLEIEGVI